MHTFRNARTRALAFVAFTLAATVGNPNLSAHADEVAPPPDEAVAITTVAPGSGDATGGLLVIVTGTGFTGATALTFGGVPATRFTVVSATRITATTPALRAGTHKLTVTTPTGTATAGKFTVRTVEQEVLRLVNEARASKRKCGSRTYKAVPALRADRTLARVADKHSADMARHDFFGHYSRNGDSPFDRIKAAGYRYSRAGENIAAGYRSPASVMKAWLASPGHCRNIMKRGYTELGIGYATGGYYGSYWTQDFGNPR